MRSILLGFACIIVASSLLAADGNRLAYLDGPLDPYYPHRDFPKLITPQWVGEEGVECVVTLAIDDMRESGKYETFLRPILNRLKQIDGRAPVSIMTCRADPTDPQIQAWLKEGLSIEVHTYDHPCPCLQDGGLVKAKETYDKCVDLMNQIPGNKPVAFRMPCCDSKNTPSPRFWAEVFNKTTDKGNFLQIDSSVFNIITNKDQELPKEITELPDGSERFRRYVPFANFVNTIEDYPYPYVIGGMCWEFPCVVPSDWSAQHVQKPNNPDTVRDWKVALDACVIKRGVFNLVFHPHGWIKAEQINELIEHAVAKHGKKVKFLTFRECAERLNQKLLFGNPIRSINGEANDVTLVDLDKSGLMNVFISKTRTRRSIIGLWNGEAQRWMRLLDDSIENQPNGNVPNGESVWRSRFSLLMGHVTVNGLDYFQRVSRASDSVGALVPKNVRVEEFFNVPRYTCEGPTEQSFTFSRDVDGDGTPEQLQVCKGKVIGIFTRRPNGVPFSPPFQELPDGIRVVDDIGRDAGFRLIDVNNDGKLDCLFSNHERYSLHLFKDMNEGWSIKVIEGIRGKEEGNIGPAIPPFVRADGTNNGAWFHSGALWLMNEDTWRLPDNVFKLTFAEMLGGKGLGARGSGLGGGEAAAKVPSTQYSVLSTTQATPNVIPDAISSLALRASAATTQPVSTQLSGPRFDDLEMTPPKSPEEALRSMHVRPGMKIELVAAEPLVVDPVAFDWGPDGRMWVVEMRDYPNGMTWNKEGDNFGVAGGRVKVLTDTNGDGRYDKASVFLDELSFPTGVKVWRKGILVTAAPEILYAEDTNGDDKADERKVLYRGFGEGNQQHRVNGLRWGLDNWLHVGNGDSGGVIKSLAAGLLSPQSNGDAREINVNGRDLRIRPDTGELDATSGNTQFGRERDDWGNWFGNNNSNPLWHYALDDHYLRRNPQATYPPVKKDVSIVPGAAPVYPRSKTLTRFNDDNKANRYTSACGPMLYRDELLGPEFYGNVFVCEPVHNLVSREIISPQGATFTSKRAADEQKSEFLASEDHWFRPSMVRTGPDGAVWVSDMYRFVIEHPKWIPPAAQKKLDMRAGDDKGRIYRIYPEGKQPRPIARLDKLDTAGLVAALDSPNGPQRDLAHQMLLWRNDQPAIESLKKVILDAKRPQTRVQALCALDGLGAITDGLLLTALADEHAAVRRHAVRLAEPRLNSSPALASAIERLTNDADAQVRIQVAYSLGQWSDPRRSRLLAGLLVSSASDPYLAAAAFSSISKDSVGDVLASLLAASADPRNGVVASRLLTMAAAMGQDAAVGKAVGMILERDRESDPPATALAAAADALARRNVKLIALLDDNAKQRLVQLLNAAREQVRRVGSTDQQRAQSVAALPLLARGLDGQDDTDMKLLAGLLSPQQPPEMRSSAVAALARTGRGEIPKLLIAGWPAHSPSMRNQIVEALAAREPWSLALLDAVAAGEISAAQFDARRRQQFLTARSRSVRERAEIVFAGAADANRQKLVEDYLASAASTAGDAARGKAAFAKRCANCHRWEGAGHAVGPDLAPLTHKPVDYLLTAILDPNRAVEDRYLEYVALTTDGRQVTGILLEETGASLTLAAPEGKQVVLPRSELDQLKSSGKSLMPEGVERDVPPAEMADILAYLKSYAPPPKQLALNQPEVVQPFNDGSIRLFASNCRAYGPTIKMEETFRALGWWNSTDDYCVWSFDVPAGGGGEYRVTLEYSCADNSAGNSVVVEANGQSLTGLVASSGGWDKFRGWTIGTVTLAEGQGELLVRSSGPIKQALFDLGGVRLAPVKQ